ncbi:MULTISPECIES: lmo0937 family membrane protein [Listeria]|uniref:lmo0937 family membrane protein n=1 Tax=Listeria TaxID=1637 RepID=UPI000B58FA41|nr:MULTISPECIES: lmo0937 family membrane protein [Listeria]
MLGIIWGIIVVLFVVWLIGLIFHIAGGLINILLVVILVLIIWNLIQSARNKRNQ